MRRRRRTTAVALAGAVALASAGYGIGSQIDDGTALAGSGQARSGASAAEGRPWFGFADLAETLGVDADRLGEVLRDFHEQRDGDRHAEFAAALADALGVPAGDVESALEDLREQLEQRFERRGSHAGPPDGLPPRGRPPHGPRWPLRQLASALDVTRAELRQALREVRAAEDADRDERGAELARFLAERFELDVSDVEQALEEARPSGPRGGRPGHGGPGHGGPGPFGPPL